MDKLDYFERDCFYAGTVKVSFDRSRLMAQARVAALDQGGDADDEYSDAEGSLHICWPVKCVFEVMQVFITRFSLHYELCVNGILPQPLPCSSPKSTRGLRRYPSC